MAVDSAVWREKLSGVFAPLTSPFDQDENLLPDRLAANVALLNKSGLRGYLVLGTNGEFKSLTEAERTKALQTVIDAAGKDKVVIAGVGRESTRETIAACQEAAALGADFVSILPPSFFPKRMTDQALRRHFLAVADASALPVLLYNNPEVGVITLSSSLIGEVSRHPNIVGMKDSSRGNFTSYVLAANEGFQLLAGSANFFLEGLFMGGVGGVLSIANFAPAKCCLVHDLWKEGRQEEAKAAQFRLMKINHAVSGHYGVAGVKAAMDLAGLYGGIPRAPLAALTAEQMKGLREELRGLMG